MVRRTGIAQARRWKLHIMAKRRSGSGAAGFTLLELLVAISILAVIAGIVYGSFAGVTDATAMARASAEKLRLHRFLRRTLTELFSSVYTDVTCAREDYYFVGTNDTGPDGPMDLVELCSSAPMMGGMSLPGALKRVTIEVTDEDLSDQTLDNLDIPIQGADTSDQPWPVLRVTETPLVVTSGLDLGADSVAAFAAAAAMVSEAVAAEAGVETEFDTPSWTVPVRSMDITYFDGEEWMEEWDSLAIGRMPWCVRVRINFAPTPEELEEEEDEGLDVVENPDLDLLVPIPLGVGTLSEFVEEEILSESADRKENSKPGPSAPGERKQPR